MKKRHSYLGRTIKRLKLIIVNIGQGILALLSRLSSQIKRNIVRARMQKADIVLASPRTVQLPPIALIYRLILRSRYVHSMLYIGNGKIIHTTSRHGVVVGRLPKKIYKRNRYTIYRVKNLSAQQRDRVIEEALKREGKKLDHIGMIINIPEKLLGLRKALISWERNRIWCSKLIIKSFQSVGIELVPEERSDTVTSEDLARSSFTERLW
jgi:hypothetical protein